LTWEVTWTRPALQDMRRLDRQVAARVHQALLRFAQTGQGDVTKLTGETQWRLRVGDWRVRFIYDFEVPTLRVLRVLPRGRAYRGD
jgi:mRNA interferase RelE/StbE